MNLGTWTWGHHVTVDLGIWTWGHQPPCQHGPGHMRDMGTPTAMSSWSWAP